MGTPKLVCPKTVYRCRKEPVDKPLEELPLLRYENQKSSTDAINC